MFSKQSIYAYSSLRTDEQGGLSATGSSTQPRCMKTPHIFQTVKISLYSLILFFLGFVLGQFFTPDRSATEGLTLSVKPYKFEMERLFGDKPSNESNAAWERLFPARGGFFNHPTIAPKRSAYAVFHQLHCLNGLRQAYWTTLEASMSPTAIEIDSIPFEISPVHMAHCIDLLRQTLMCKPDLTVEIKNETLQGVTGFGTVHQCRNWDELMHWMAEWEDIGAPQHIPGEVGNGHSHHHGS